MAAFVEVPPHDGWHWGRRQGLLLKLGTPLGENGRRLCRWCHGPTEPPRRCWCSKECDEKYMRVWSWAAMRVLITARYDSTCARCTTRDPPIPRERELYRSPWDVDHIIRVTDGGTDDPENLRLLCMTCHTKVGYEQRESAKPESDQLRLDY